MKKTTTKSKPVKVDGPIVKRIKKEMLTLVVPSIFGITVPYPFNSTRILFVNQEKPLIPFLKDAMSNWNKGIGVGRKGLYRGYLVTASPYIFYKFLDLGVNRFVKKKINAEYIDPVTKEMKRNNIKMFLCGMMSGAFSGFVYCQFERVQAWQNVVQKNLLEAYRDIKAVRGYRGMHTGIVYTMCRDSLFSAAILGWSFTIKDGIKSRVGPKFAKKHPLLLTVLSGATSGSIIGFVTNPFDLMRTQLQGDPLTAPRSSLQVAKDVWKHGDGGFKPKNYFKGANLRVLRIAFAGTTLLVVLDLCKRQWRKKYPDELV